MKLATKRYSLCDCGFPLLNDEVPLGQIYDVEIFPVENGTLICGGCKKAISVRMVWVESRDGGKPGYLPWELFE